MSDTPRALIVYESMFGNTWKVAAAIRDGLGTVIDTDLVRVDLAPAEIPADVRLLVVGGPTHAFSMSRPSTRADAAKQGDVVMPLETGIREWLGALPNRTTPTLTVTFDTRITKVRRLPGSAARSAAKLLRRRGFRAMVPPTTFFVEDTTGPIEGRELARARQWGVDLGRELGSVLGPSRRGTRRSA
ncbi:flavodoxin [Kribbella orskensis]|uniref:Flavodoxin n=1 Tax=Kribbella orskensis TaxID=2512216 RepID=A0ABY2B8F9_9ACTN|nr:MULTISPECIES: flavodoxin family protein [Kribbella]TCN31149.1 flavodoxin [Kribbella sp. VKM Ac-2500]TCO11655.1 flavodoxin [Kribbella orskensis]